MLPKHFDTKCKPFHQIPHFLRLMTECVKQQEQTQWMVSILPTTGAQKHTCYVFVSKMTTPQVQFSFPVQVSIKCTYVFLLQWLTEIIPSWCCIHEWNTMTSSTRRSVKCVSLLLDHIPQNRISSPVLYNRPPCSCSTFCHLLWDALGNT